MSMKLSKKALDEFKAIYKAEYSIELTDSEALNKGIRVLRLFKAVYRPIKNTTQNNYGKTENDTYENK